MGVEVTVVVWILDVKLNIVAVDDQAEADVGHSSLNYENCSNWQTREAQRLKKNNEKQTKKNIKRKKTTMLKNATVKIPCIEFSLNKFENSI